MPLFNLSESLEDFPSQTYVVFDLVNPQLFSISTQLADEKLNVFASMLNVVEFNGKSQIEHAFATCSIQRVLKDN